MNNNNLDWIAIIISVIALLHTMYVDYKSQKFNKKVTKEGVMSVFFKELYFNILTVEFPELINSFNNGIDNKSKIEILEKIDSIIVNILDKALFYKYYDDKFYEKIREIVITFQDLIFKIQDSLDKGTYRSETYGAELDLNVSNLYKTLLNYYSSI